MALKVTHATISLRRANRWKTQVKGVVWADPAMLASLYARVCREKRVPFFEKEFDNHPALGSFKGRMNNVVKGGKWLAPFDFCNDFHTFGARILSRN